MPLDVIAKQTEQVSEAEGRYGVGILIYGENISIMIWGRISMIEDLRKKLAPYQVMG